MANSIPARRISIWLCILGLSAYALLITTRASAQTPDSEAIQVIGQVWSIESDADTPPADSADWQLTALPIADLIGNAEHSDRVLWFRFELDEPEDRRLYSLYFYRYNLSIDVFFNGQRIGGDTYVEGRQTVSWNHPRLVDIQQANWELGNNSVYIRFQASYFGGTFSEILFGPQEVLQPLYDDRMFRQVRVNEWLQASGILVTLLVLALWIMRRQDPVYLLFVGITTSWLVLQTHMVVYHNLIDYRFWLPLVHIGIDSFVLFLFLFLTRFASVPSPRMEKFMLGWSGFALLWHLLAPITFWWVGAYYIHAIGNVSLFYLLYRIGMRAVRERDPMAIIIGITVIVQLSLGLHDFFLIINGNEEDWESAMYLSQFSFPLLLLVFTIGLLNRFVSALNMAEELNRDLELKVDASRKMIQASFQEQRELELSRAAEQERVKIYRDLHDDVGSKLLSIVHAGRDHKLGELARSALGSLRDAVSRANSPQQNLVDFIAKLKEEALLRLEGTGHEVLWIQTGDLPDTVLNSETVYHLNQILREIVSNIIRHAGATIVELEISSQNQSWSIRIADNGCGLGEEAPTGNGLVHIRQRADSIRCQIEWHNRDSSGVEFILAFSDEG